MQLLKKLDENLLKGLLTLFIFFIPLFPKFPFQVVNFTYIAIRLDDFLAALITFVFVLELVRGRISWQKLTFKKPILIFWAAVFLAFLSGLFLTKTIDYPFIGLLHALRRIEYMMLFFIAMASVRTVKDFKYYLYAILACTTMVIVYGLGQRLLGFPAVSTMNPEFAKGRVLFLTPEARLSSTFAGHYDLGAYLVFYFPLLWAAVFYTKKLASSLTEKISLFALGIAPLLVTMYALGKAVFTGSPVQVMLSAIMEPQNAIVVIAMAITLVVFMVAFTRLRKVTMLLLIVMGNAVLVATSSRTSSIALMASSVLYLIYIRKFWYVPLFVVVFAGFTYFDNDLVDRWFKTIQVKQIIINETTGEEVIVQEIRSDELPAGTSFINFGKSDESSLSAEIKENLAIKQASLGGKIRTEDYETYSAVAADISLAVRFQVSWPRAWQAFLRNPLLGSGPSSITESSDGDYMRWIGEMGALGTGAFLFVIGSISRFLFTSRRKVSKEGQYLVMAVLFGTFGLFVNAILIDVFEASKVAYMFWLTLGLFVGLFQLKDTELDKV